MKYATAFSPRDFNSLNNEKRLFQNQINSILYFG